MLCQRNPISRKAPWKLSQRLVALPRKRGLVMKEHPRQFLELWFAPKPTTIQHGNPKAPAKLLIRRSL